MSCEASMALVTRPTRPTSFPRSPRRAGHRLSALLLIHCFDLAFLSYKMVVIITGRSLQSGMRAHETGCSCRRTCLATKASTPRVPEHTQPPQEPLRSPRSPELPHKPPRGCSA